jgi:hypothetical protein
MPWSGSSPSQQFTRTDGTSSGDDTWTQAAAAPRNIEADDHDTHDTDLKDGINACLKKDGGNTATADIPMGGFSLTNLGAAGSRTESVSFADVQDNKGQYVATVGGTADVITLTPTIPITAYVAGQRFSFIAGGTNTGATTVNVSAVGAKAIARRDGSHTALSAGEIVSGALNDIEYDGTRFHLLSENQLRAAANLSDVASATTARTNLGVGTGDSPEFTAVNIGHATQNTLTGSGGDLSVEGNLLYRAGGTDVPVADGGTGASTAANARTNLGIAYASQTEMETATAADKVVAPGTQHFHPGMAKGWIVFQGSDGATLASYGNISGATRSNTGRYVVNFSPAFSSANYALCGWVFGAGNSNVLSTNTGDTKLTTACGVSVYDSGGNLSDPTSLCVIVFGDLS